MLYVEVAPDKDAANLAMTCWREVEKLGPNLFAVEGGTRQVLRAIHSLRFLGEAFRARPEPIAPFQAALGANSCCFSQPWAYSACLT